MADGVKLFNYVRQESSDRFKEVVPSATEDNIMALSNILFNDAYTPMLNEFVTNLINRIALTIIKNKSFTNPLAMFKKGSIPLGTDVQEVFTNPAVAEQYELNDVAMAKLLTLTDPDTHVAYFRRNRQDLYTKTIGREALQGAFVSWDKFSSYVESITTSLYSGNYIDEFEYTKKLVDGAYDGNKVIVKQVSAPVDEATSKAFLKECRALYNKMKFPSTEYNAYSKFSGAKGSIKTWTEDDRVVLITTADVMAEVDVDALAGAFNIDRANFMGRVVVVDKFDNDEILAVMCDESWLQIYDNVFRFDEFYNARTMTWNEYLHAWGTYAISPFANAVVLATALPVPATALAVGNATKTLAKGNTANVTYTLTPSTATTDVTAETTDMRIATASISGGNVVIKGVEAGSCTIVVKTDNGLQKEIAVTVTAS